MSEPNPHLSPPVKKRRRPALSCEQCRRRKVRCDRGSPCSTCVQSGNKTCSYAAPPRPRASHPRVIRPTPPTSSIESPEEPSVTSGGSGGVAAVQTTTPDSTGNTSIDWVFGRTLLHPPEVTAKTDTADNAELESLAQRIRQLEWQVENGKPPPGPTQGKKRPMRGMLEKTRFFGPSHWSNAVNLVGFAY